MSNILPFEHVSGPSKAVQRDLVVQPNPANLSPTEQAYGEWQFAYDYFNSRLFDGYLPGCLITLTRKPRVLGYFSPDRFASTGGAAAHEISLNPQYLELQGDYLALSTLVHEQAHLFRHVYGPRDRKGGTGSRGYHDRAWAKVMLAVGLVPSNTGEPGGAQTGHSMSHYVAEGGPFDVACRELLLSGFSISWRDALRRAALADGREEADPHAGDTQAASRGGRMKFTCPICALNAWAKPSAQLGCASCSALMSPNERG